MAKTKPTTPFSIKALRNIQAEMVLLNPFNNEPINNPATGNPVKIFVVSQDSKVFYNAQFEALNKLKKIHEDTKELPTAEQQREATYTMVAGLVVGWNEDAEAFFIDEFDGDAKYTTEKAFKLLSNDEYFWIVKQVETFIIDKTRFFPKQ